MRASRRSISAWAESSTARPHSRCTRWVYLRVGGVISGSFMSPPLFEGLSPRGRSHPAEELSARTHQGSISAWAESSERSVKSLASTKVYLRVGGVIIATPGSSGLL